jgi:hypothetical protein
MVHFVEKLLILLACQSSLISNFFRIWFRNYFFRIRPDSDPKHCPKKIFGSDPIRIHNTALRILTSAYLIINCSASGLQVGVEAQILDTTSKNSVTIITIKRKQAFP